MHGTAQIDETQLAITNEWQQVLSGQHRGNQHRGVDYMVWFVLLSALLLYGLTLDNGLQPEELRGGDLITHQYAQVQARPGNAPGYPLYTMGGWLWFRLTHAVAAIFTTLPPNPIPFLSSYSTLWALLALWLLYRILHLLFLDDPIPPNRLDQIIRGPSLWPIQWWPIQWWPIQWEQRLAGWLTLFYGVTYFFWYYATTTEQYSSAIAQTLAILFLYLHWQKIESLAGAQPEKARRALRLLLLLALLCGISLAHMLTVAFIVPPLVFVILWQAPTLIRQVRTIALAIGAAALPLVSYLYVYLRGAGHPEWWGHGDWVSAADWFWQFVSTTQGREELGWGFEAWCTPFANGFPQLIVQELTWPVLLLGLVGFCWSGRRLAVLCWGTTLIYLAFSWAYRCGNWFQVILPLYPFVIIGFGLFVYKSSQWLLHRGTTFRRAPWLRWHQGAIELLLFVSIALRVVHLWPAVDSRSRVDDTALDRAFALITPLLPAGQSLFADLDDTLALQYVTTIGGLRSDLQSVSAQQAGARLAAGETVYSTWTMAPTLRAELPDALQLTQMAIDPHWVRFATNTQSIEELTQNLLATTMPSNNDLQQGQLLGHQQLAQQLLPTVTLDRYIALAQPSLSWAITNDRQGKAAAIATDGIDLFLIWALEDGRWPDDLAISLRLTANGIMVAGQQIDRTQPVMGLNDPPAELVLDPYHFTLLGEAQRAIDGALLILYRPTVDGFENLATIPLPLRTK